MYPFISFHFFSSFLFKKKQQQKIYWYGFLAYKNSLLLKGRLYKRNFMRWFFPSIHSLLTLTATVYCFNLGRALADILICDRHSIDFFFYIIRRYTRTLVRDKFLKIFIILFPLSFIIFFWFIMKNEGFKWSGLYFFFPSYHFRFIYEKSKGKIIIQIKSL